MAGLYLRFDAALRQVGGLGEGREGGGRWVCSCSLHSLLEV